jgi:hypothetical protein
LKTNTTVFAQGTLKAVGLDVFIFLCRASDSHRADFLFAASYYTMTSQHEVLSALRDRIVNAFYALHRNDAELVPRLNPHLWHEEDQSGIHYCRVDLFSKPLNAEWPKLLEFLEWHPNLEVQQLRVAYHGATNDYRGAHILFEGLQENHRRYGGGPFFGKNAEHCTQYDGGGSGLLAFLVAGWDGTTRGDGAFSVLEADALPIAMYQWPSNYGFSNLRQGKPKGAMPNGSPNIEVLHVQQQQRQHRHHPPPSRPQRPDLRTPTSAMVSQPAVFGMPFDGVDGMHTAVPYLPQSYPVYAPRPQIQQPQRVHSPPTHVTGYP